MSISLCYAMDQNNTDHTPKKVTPTTLDRLNENFDQLIEDISPIQQLNRSLELRSSTLYYGDRPVPSQMAPAYSKETELIGIPFIEINH